MDVWVLLLKGWCYYSVIPLVGQEHYYDPQYLGEEEETTRGNWKDLTFKLVLK